jgi:site-specific DNA-cytosine methylase
VSITIKAADLFCGAGGASTGLMRAAAALGVKVDLLAVNHWPTAVETHSLNHPGVRHLCEEVDKINPREAVPGGRLHLLLAGPECTHHSGLAEPFLTKYNGTAKTAQSVAEPLDTISTRDRFGLVQPVINGYVLDIRFRMLQPHELAAATSFPKEYQFCGKKEDVVKQIGNAWPGETAKALCLEVITPYAKRGRTNGRKERVA